MTTIEVHSKLSFDTLLESLQQLDSEELGELARHASRLRAQRHVPHLSELEADLLLKINEGVVPHRARKRCAVLTVKARAGTITLSEHDELIRLVDEIEELNARRTGYLVELATLRQVSLDTLMDTMEISPLTYE